MITVEEFLDNIAQYGLEYYGIYVGSYRGIVEDNADPENRGRIKAHVPAVGQERAPHVWIKPSQFGAGPNRGAFWPPEIGDAVYVKFAQGNPSKPEFYEGGWYGYPEDESDAPEELRPDGVPTTRGFVTRMGHSLVMSDEEGDERLELTWNKPNSGDAALSDVSQTASRPGSTSQGGGTASLKFTSDGSVEIRDNSNPEQSVILNAQEGNIQIEDKYGNKVVLDSRGVRIEGVLVDLGGDATDGVIKGNSWLQWAAVHTHPTSMGASGPPTTPPTAALLSTKVKVK
jgi:hypothetical protein